MQNLQKSPENKPVKEVFRANPLDRLSIGFAEWLELRELYNPRMATLSLWIETNYERYGFDKKPNDKAQRYVWDTYFLFLTPVEV